MTDSFVHLHVHTEYSMLDGAARVKELLAEAKRLGMPAAAITDHGNMHGAYDFHQQAVAAGVTPIIGVEAYVAPESRLNKSRIKWGRAEQKSDDVAGSGAYTHMTMWARNPAGLRNLMRLTSRASLEGQLGKYPRMDLDIIAEHADGIMGTTGCPSGAVQTRLRLGQFDEALKSAAQYQEALGKDNYFLEIMDHGLSIEKRVRDGLLEIGRKLDIPPLVTNDSHYTHEAQAEAHDVLLCVQTGSNVADPNRFRFDGNGYYVKSADQMRAVDSSDAWQQGCANTLLVAERVESYQEVFVEKNRMPLFPVPDGETQMSWLRKETMRGMKKRFPSGIPQEHLDRCEFELGIIEQMGFPSYFLVVADLLRVARERKIRYAPGRGSATGCDVAYALEIIELDPIHHGLLFERFLNPERISMPDIDLDFDESRRGEIIAYMTEAYGSANVCQIVTFGTIKAKAAIKDSARVLGYPFAVGDRITKALPPDVMGKGIPLSGIFDKEHKRYNEAGEVRSLYEQDPDVKKVIDTARGIEGLIRQTGVHAAGTILSGVPLQDVIPVTRNKDGLIISGWDYPACESLGLLKMDFLGLRNLKILDDAVNNVRANHDPTFELSAHHDWLEDPDTYKMLATGETLGVFQLDGGPMRSLLKAMAPTAFTDIAAVLALYRPGPMAVNAHIDYADRKNNRKPVVPIHEELREPLADIVGETYGLIVYQEQVQKAAQRVAGYSLGAADLLRRAMGKKKKEILDKEFVNFEAGMKANDFSDEAITALWDVLLPFSGYAFNKSHTAGYGIISYWTAYLKTHYQAEYMAALLTSVGDDKDKMAVYLAECRRMGITVLAPDVNESAGPFTPVGKDIRFGLAAVRNIGNNVVDGIVRARHDKGAFRDFYDFLSKVDAAACNKKVADALIKSGAFDSLGHTRQGLLGVHAEAIDAYAEVKRNEAIGQFDLFAQFGAEDGSGSAPVAMPSIGTEEWDKRTKLTFEREMLGLYVSDHPLAGTEALLSRYSQDRIISIGEDSPDRQNVEIAGLITAITRRVTKEGRTWAVVSLEDLTGSVEVLFFPNSYEEVGQELIEDRIIAVRGRVNHRENETSVFGSDVRVVEMAATGPGGTAPVTISVDTARVTPDLVAELKRILISHPGKAPAHIKLRNGSRTTLMNLQAVKVESSIGLNSELKGLLGAGCLEG